MFEIIETKQLLSDARLLEMKKLVDSGMSGMESVIVVWHNLRIGLFEGGGDD